MGDFFKGWRRKVGCVTLMMAAGLTGMWIRTLGGHDTFEVRLGDEEYKVVSSTDGLWYDTFRAEFPPTGFPIQRFEYRRDTVSPPLEVIQFDEFRPLILISHAFVVLPLILLSACLILWPGKRPAKRPQSDQTPAEGT